jgi:hypothetical protein
MVDDVTDVTNVVVIGNVCEVAFAAMFTAAGTCEYAEELVRLTLIPPVGAGPLR